MDEFKEKEEEVRFFFLFNLLKKIFNERTSLDNEGLN
jgi:hypothetical protein